MAGKSSKGPSKTLSKAESGQLAKWCQVPRKGPVSLLLGSLEDIGLVLVWRCLELVKTLLTPVMHALRRVDAEACALACLVAGAFACWPWSLVRGSAAAGVAVRSSLRRRRARRAQTCLGVPAGRVCVHTQSRHTRPWGTLGLRA